MERKTTMRFDYTDGKKAKYIVNHYNWNVEDHSYYHSYSEAKEAFERLKKVVQKGGVVSIYDMEKDVRKAFHKA